MTIQTVYANYLQTAGAAIVEQIIAESMRASAFTRMATTLTRTPGAFTVPLRYDLYPDFIDGEVISSCLVEAAG